MLPFANPCVILRERNPRCHAANVTMFARFAFAELPLYIARGSLLHPKKLMIEFREAFATVSVNLTFEKISALLPAGL
jgi:hypothetical protein